MALLLSVSLVLAALAYTQAWVYNNFDNCLNFFYKNQVPSGFQGVALPDLFDKDDKNLPDLIKRSDLGSPAYICQTYNNIVRFATLYDRGRLMPLYSAYIMEVKPENVPSLCSRPKNFQSEPQLAYRALKKGDMTADASKVLSDYNDQKKIDQTDRMKKNQAKYLLKTSQSGKSDYEKIQDYDKGHLNPCGHHSAHQDKLTATFTYTNVVPMIKEMNNKIWSQYEVKMIDISRSCDNMYVIVGIVPGNVRVQGSRLYPPAYVWNAYCCVKGGGPFQSGAALAENVKKSQIQTFTIEEFQKKLEKLLDVYHTIELFENNCKR
ncbi:hypothetical protein GDO81_009121 [Engystomops pustulosus]|uniref:Endonuclease domain-containing 1 protein-like n=1 Tax=Engystomops pustulosus TaxID=76066 RepID=A0AAV7BP27_ENGPU|nr:hypothetical protein GDO81_009121 [Engystomops pustulosus]